MPANSTFTAGQILTAAQQNNFPLGVVTATAGGTSGIGYVLNTTASVAIAAAIGDVSGMTITFTAATNRLYKVTVNLNDIFTNAGMSPFLLEVTDAANVTKYQARRLFTAGDTESMTVCYVETGITGSIVRKVRVAGITNSGVFNQNVASALSTFVIEDIGSVS